MIHTVFTFASNDLEDDPEAVAMGVNGIAGSGCARWIGGHLQSEGISVPREPIAEDWGWALVVDLGQDKLLVGCAAADDIGPSHWRVMVSDNFLRGMFPWTRKRRTEALALLSERIAAFLESQDSVTQLVSEPGEV